MSVVLRPEEGLCSAQWPQHNDPLDFLSVFVCMYACVNTEWVNPMFLFGALVGLKVLVLCQQLAVYFSFITR